MSFEIAVVSLIVAAVMAVFTVAVVFDLGHATPVYLQRSPGRIK